MNKVKPIDPAAKLGERFERGTELFVHIEGAP
jgi:hypothetical protein